MKLKLASIVLLCLIGQLAKAEFQVLKTGLAIAPMNDPGPLAVGKKRKWLKDGKPYSSELVSAEKGAYSWVASDGCSWSHREHFGPAHLWDNCGGNTGDATVTSNGNPWPLSVGHVWSYRVKGSDWETARECKVKDGVRVKTVLGENDTFLIECYDRWNTRTYYYSPERQQSVVYIRHRRTKAIKETYISTE